MTRILANDFGQNHGYTLYDTHTQELTSWERFYGLDGHRAFRASLTAILSRDTIFLGERFLFLHENRDRTKIDFTPCEYIGVAKVYCQMNEIEMEWQNASQACGVTAFWGDDKNGGNAKIKKLGLWQAGKTHAMDSLRHLLYYVSFEMNNDYFIQLLKD